MTAIDRHGGGHPIATQLIVLSPEQLEALVERAVKRALDGRASAEPADYLTTRQCAELVGVHPRSIVRLVRDEGLPVVRLGEKTLRYERAAVLAWLDARAK